MRRQRLPRSLSADSPLSIVSSGLLPSALFVAVPNVPPPEVPPGTLKRLSAGLVNTIRKSSLLNRSLSGVDGSEKAARGASLPARLRARSDSDGAVARFGAEAANKNNNNDSRNDVNDATTSPNNRTGHSATSALSSDPAASASEPSGNRKLRPGEHRQLFEVDRPPTAAEDRDERGSDPDTSLYDYSEARDIEEPRRQPSSALDEDGAFGFGDETESQVESEHWPPLRDVEEQTAPIRSPRTDATISELTHELISPPPSRTGPRSQNDLDETIPKVTAHQVMSGPTPGCPPVRETTPLPEVTKDATEVRPTFADSSSSTVMADLKKENKTLKDAVHRLNVELSKYQSKYRQPTTEDGGDELGLPSRGPIPSWLINTKYLAPLFSAYDDRIKEKDDIIRKYEVDLDKFQSQVDAIVTENRSLKARLAASASDLMDTEDADGHRIRRHRRRTDNDIPGAITPAEWQPLQKQACLVLRENEVLLEQMRVQDEKLKEACRVHCAEVATLTKKLAMAEAGMSALESELGQLRVQLSTCKAQNEALTSQIRTKVDGILHQTVIADCNQRLEALKETKDSEVNSLAAALRVKTDEHLNASRQYSELQAANRRLSIELGQEQKANRTLKENLERLELTLQDVDSKKKSAMASLSEVVNAARRTAADRDAYKKLALKQKRGELKILSKMAESEQCKEKLAQQVQMSRKELEQHLVAEKAKMKESLREYCTKQQEYEREIRRLRCLLREKDLELGDAANDKKHLEDEIELVWQASCRGSRRNDPACSAAQCRYCEPYEQKRQSSCGRYISPDHSQG